MLGLGFEDLEVPEPDGGEDLRRLRQARGWTRAEAAERLGLQPFTLQRVEEGLELPPDPRKMARVYRVSRMELAAAAGVSVALWAVQGLLSSAANGWLRRMEGTRWLTIGGS